MVSPWVEKNRHNKGEKRKKKKRGSTKAIEGGWRVDQVKLIEIEER